MELGYETWNDEAMDAFASAIFGRLRSEATAGLPVNYTSQTSEASALVSSGGGKLCGFTVYNGNAATRYVQLFDATSLPANGSVPVIVYPILTVATLALEYLRPRVFQRGIYIANSTTAATLTLGSGDSLFDVQYV